MLPRVSGAYIVARTTASGERRFHVKYRQGGRYTRVEHAGAFKTKRDATTRRDLVRELLAAGKNPRVELAVLLEPAVTFREAHSAWLASRRSVTRSTIRGYEARAVRLLNDLGKETLDHITVARIVEWVGDLERDYKPGTVRLFVTQVRLVLDHAGVHKNAARDRRVELPRMLGRELDPPTAEECVDLLERVDGKARVAVVVMEQLGGRVTETLTLTPADVDHENGRVRFRREATKTGRSRWVGAPDVLLDALEDKLPFTGDRDSIRRKMRAVSTINPHALRHRRASLWHQQGVVAVELARRLGHARPSLSLDLYSHVKPLTEIDPHDLASLLR